MQKQKQHTQSTALHSSLTWALCEVVEAAILGPDAAFIAVACPIHTVHPPVSGRTAHVSAAAAFPRTTPRHQVVLSQSRNHQQQAGKLHRGSHHEGVGVGGAEQKSTPWLPQYLIFTTLTSKCSPLLDVFIPTLVLLYLCHAHDRERERLEYQPSPTQPRLCSATGALVTWNSCVRLLCPAPQFSSRNRSAERPTVQNTPFQLWSDSHVPHAVCAPLP